MKRNLLGCLKGFWIYSCLPVFYWDNFPVPKLEKYPLAAEILWKLSYLVAWLASSFYHPLWTEVKQWVCMLVFQEHVFPNHKEEGARIVVCKSYFTSLWRIFPQSGPLKQREGQYSKMFYVLWVQLELQWAYILARQGMSRKLSNLLYPHTTLTISKRRCCLRYADCFSMNPCANMGFQILAKPFKTWECFILGIWLLQYAETACVEYFLVLDRQDAYSGTCARSF